MVHVCVVGVGNMGGAFVRGVGRGSDHRITAVDADSDALEAVAPDATETTTDLAAASDADVVVLAVKPDVVGTVLEELDLSADQTLVTFAAGVERAFVAERTDASVVRAMPNLAAETGDMAAAVTPNATEEVAAVLGAAGEVVKVDEQQMDVATAVNGSGPAFVFYLIDAMKAAGVEHGLGQDEAERLAAQTFKGAAETVLRDDRSVDELIDAVCSPKGTTIEGMEVLWDSDVQQEVGAAVAAAERRARELAGTVDDE